MTCNTNWMSTQLGFLRRAEDGSVEVGSGSSFEDVVVTSTLAASEWASIVAHLSAHGDHHVSHGKALAFHNGGD